MGRPRFLAEIALVGLALAGTGAAEESTDPWQRVEAAAADPTTLAERLGALAEDLAAAALPTSTSGAVTVHAPAVGEREPAAKRLDAGLQRATAAMTALGFPVDPMTLTVLYARRSEAPPLVVSTATGPWVLYVNDPPRPTAPPSEPGKRAEGPPTLRDLVLGSDAVRFEAAGPACGPQCAMGDLALPRALARHAVRSAGLASGPRWLVEGMAALVDERTTPGGDAAPIHVCASGARRPADLAAILEPRAATHPATARLIGRVLAALSSTPGFADKIASIAASSDEPGAAALEAQFGAAAAEALARALGSATPAGCEAGTVACPACRGTRKVDAACPVCSALGAVACPSCRGSTDCPSTYCIDGWHYYEGGTKVRCKYCDGGVVKCRGCASQGRMPCRGCAGAGKVSLPCLACGATGRLPCPQAALPDAGGSAGSCPWCADTTLSEACAGCRGCGYQGCLACDGTTRALCGACGGTGEKRMVYKDGTAASSTKCPDCRGIGFSRCDECTGGKRSCETCSGGAVAPVTPARCPACEGTARAATAEQAAKRRARILAPLTAEERSANAEMLGRSVRFLLGCVEAKSGEFTLAHERWKPESDKLVLESPTLFSNSLVLWTLFVSGIGRDDARLTRAWERLRTRVGALASSKEDLGVQEVSFALRALVAGGEDPKGPLVTGLVARLVKAQRPDGLWADTLADTDKGSAYSALFAVESLRLASLRGTPVPSSTWSRALSGSIASFETIAKANRKGWTSGTEVASSTALVLMAKAGTLGNRATSLEPFRSIPAVGKGLAWLDRYFEIEDEPVISSGARVRDDSDAGYAAYLYAVQRLAQLLSLESVGGQRWYATGSRHLAKLQLADGSFEERARNRLNGAVRSTCSVVLFLLKATPPLTSTGGGGPDAR